MEAVPHLERATIEAVHKYLDVSHVWITKFVKLPKDTVELMRFPTCSELKKLMLLIGSKMKGSAKGCQAARQIFSHQSQAPTSHLPSVSAGPSSRNGGQRKPS